VVCGSGCDGSGSLAIEVLQEIVSSEFDLFVSPLRGSVLASDQAGPMHSTKVPVDEGVLVGGLRLSLDPIAVEHVLVSVDKPSCVYYSALVD
jgi:hypothetical protein